jgi:hypothetical protein
MNQGILPVTYDFGVETAIACLPPEHRVVAVRDDPVRLLHELLIEGPDMPPPRFTGGPDRVMIFVTETHDFDEPSKVRRHGHWQHVEWSRWPLPDRDFVVPVPAWLDP